MAASPSIDVYLITGFLGSGKTTLLNRLIRAFPAHCRLMVLMNEFGELGIDGHLVEGPQGLEMLEISRGSVFCACAKTEFIKALAAIAGKIRPQVLIIEATGTANPTDIRKDLNLSLFEGRYRFREQICLLDAENFTAHYETFSAVEKQITAATRFVLNKIDRTSAAELENVRAILHTHHPDPRIHEAVYAQVALEDWLHVPHAPDPLADQRAEGPALEDVEQTLSAVVNDPFGALVPPDPLGTAVYRWSGGDREAWADLTAQFPPGIVRAKGFVTIDGQTYLFSRVGRTHDLIPWENRPLSPETAGRLVVIGPPAALEVLQTLAETRPYFSLISQRAPFGFDK